MAGPRVGAGGALRGGPNPNPNQAVLFVAAPLAARRLAAARLGAGILPGETGPALPPPAMRAGFWGRRSPPASDTASDTALDAGRARRGS